MVGDGVGSASITKFSRTPMPIANSPLHQDRRFIQTIAATYTKSSFLLPTVIIQISIYASSRPLLLAHPPPTTMASDTSSEDEWHPSDGIHPNLVALFKDRRFWTDFWWTTEAACEDPRYAFMDEVSNFQVWFPLSDDGDRIELSMEGDLCYFELFVSNSEYDTWSVAHDDQAHPFPHVLRWEEVELICRAAAHFDPDGPLGQHPGVGMLLLLRWTPICRGDDVDRIAEMLEVAFREATGEAFSLKDVHQHISRRDFRDCGFRWRYSEENQIWHLKQDEDFTVASHVYTTRHGEEGEKFPHEGFKTMLTLASEAVAADPPVQLPLRDPNTKRYFRKQMVNYTLKLQLAGPDRSICSNGDMVEDTIALTLEVLDLGVCRNTGMMSGSGRKSADLLSLRLNVDERDRGVDVIRDILRWGMAPEGCEVWGEKVENVDLQLDDWDLLYRDEDGRPEMFFMLASMNCKETGWMWRPWEQRLPPSIVDNIRSLPEVQVGDLDSDGWMELKTEDGGIVRVYATQAGEGVDTKKCIIAIKELTMGVAVVICTLLETALDGGRLALMPPALVTKEPAQGPKRRSFVKVEAPEMFEILGSGPMHWWVKREGGRASEEHPTRTEVEKGLTEEGKHNQDQAAETVVDVQAHDSTVEDELVPR